MDENVKKMIENAKSGDEEAFNEVFRRFYGKAYGIAWQITKNDADAKDAVQETFLSIHGSLKDLREVEYFSSWMRMIIISKCNKIFRKKHDLPYDPDIFTNSNKKEYRLYMTPHDYNDYLSEQEVLQSLIANLHPRYQIIVEYVYLRQLKIDETAKLLNLSPGTVKTRLHRARKDLLHEIRKFEKENHRKLEFHSHVATAGIAGSCLSFLSMVKQGVLQFSKTVTSNTLSMVSCAAVGTLIVTGGVFTIQDHTSKATAQNIPAVVHNSKNEQVKKEETIVSKENTFKATPYFDKVIYTNKDAYFICVNFAMNEDDMKNKAPEELEAIAPLYESLKEENSVYWHRLQEEGWVSLYENTMNL